DAKHGWIRLEHNADENSHDGRGPTRRAAAAGATAADASTRAAAARDRAGHADLDSPGHGLAGLRERVDSAGGTLTIGNRDGGGFVLRATT
ncbi:hypothetical protein AB0I21_17070, partial [Dactylosporangium sp. NPDC050588]